MILSIKRLWISLSLHDSTFPVVHHFSKFLRHCMHAIAITNTQLLCKCSLPSCNPGNLGQLSLHLCCFCFRAVHGNLQKVLMDPEHHVRVFERMYCQDIRQFLVFVNRFGLEEFPVGVVHVEELAHLHLKRARGVMMCNHGELD